MFKRIGAFILITSLCLVLSVCKKTPTVPDTPVLPVQVTLLFNVINSYYGPVTSFTKDVMSYDVVTITMEEIINAYGVSGIDDKRMALWRSDYLIQEDADTDGDVKISSAPNQNTTYDLYVFDMIEGLDYSVLDPLSQTGERPNWATLLNSKRHPPLRESKSRFL